jgi:hypothetical protein
MDTSETLDGFALDPVMLLVSVLERGMDGVSYGYWI